MEIIMKLKDMELIRDVKHTRIYRGTYAGEKYYLKVLRNYNKRVKNQDVVRSKEELEKIGLKCFSIVENGVVDGEKYYISKEVKGKDFEELIDEGKTYEELKSKIEETMGLFMKMLKNNLYYFGYNLKNFMVLEDEVILIDIEEVQRKLIFKRKAEVKTVWNALRSLKAASDRCSLPYEELEEMLFKKYHEIVGDSSALKKDIKRYKDFRSLKKRKL